MLDTPDTHATEQEWAAYWSDVTGLDIAELGRELNGSAAAAWALGGGGGGGGDGCGGGPGRRVCVSQILLAQEEDASRILVRLSLMLHAPIVLYYIAREAKRECGFEPELLSLPFLQRRLSMLYEAIDWQMGGVLAAAGAPEALAPQISRNPSHEKSWDKYEANYLAVLRDHQTIYEPPDEAFLTTRCLNPDGSVARDWRA